MTDLSDTFIKALPDLTLVVRRDGLVLSNLGGRELGIAAQPGELSGKTLRDLWPGELGEGLTRLIRRSLKTRVASDGRWQQPKTRLDVRVRPQGPDRVLMVMRSSPTETAERSQSGDFASVDASDPADCSLFAQHFCNVLASAKLRESPVALAIVHFDGLAAIGQVVGESTARTLLTLALERATVFATEARWSGKRPPRAVPLESDQLAVLIEDMPGRDQVAASTQKMRAALAKPFNLDRRCYELNPIAGIAVYPTDGSTPEALLDAARAAVLEARRLGCDETVTVHAHIAGTTPLSQADLDQELRWAVQKEQFTLGYAPVLELSGRRTTNLSTFVQWVHPVCGPVDPDSFLPTLDTLDLRAELDRWVLRRGLKDLAHLSERGNNRLGLMIKLAKRSFDTASLVEDIVEAARAADINLSRLDVSIDLKTLAAGSAVRQRLHDLRKLGTRIHLAHFGEDGIALERLHSLPLDGVILAPALVARLDVDPIARKVCAAAIVIAKAFDLKSLAENVCNRAQLELLYECGCELAGGPMLGRPKPILQWSSQQPEAGVLQDAQVTPAA